MLAWLAHFFVARRKLALTVSLLRLAPIFLCSANCIQPVKHLTFARILAYGGEGVYHTSHMNDVYLPVVLGTGRAERASDDVATFLRERLKAKEGVKTELIDVKDYVKAPYTIAAWVKDERAKPWREIAKKADGFVLVVPEYNHSFPGELKILLDYAYKEYFGKPVALAGVASGGYGGVRAIEHMLAVVTGLKMFTVPKTLATANVGELFEEGNVGKEKYTEFADGMFDQLIEYATKLKKDS